MDIPFLSHWKDFEISNIYYLLERRKLNKNEKIYSENNEPCGIYYTLSGEIEVKI